MKKIMYKLKKINYKLLIAIIVTLLLPTLYKTIRIYYLGNISSTHGIDIASQMQWVDLLYEIIQEALILPLFFILGKDVKDKIKLSNKIRGGLIVTTLIYSIMSICIIIFARPLVNIMAQNKDLIVETVKYIRLETVASLFQTLVKFLMITLIIINKDKLIYKALIFQLFLSIIFDSVFIGDFSYSLKIGVNGIAITNIIVNLLLIVILTIMLKKNEIEVFKIKDNNYKWLKEWFNVGKYSGLESLLRNLAFMVMIVRMVNIVNEQGNYWIANSFIWNWLLIPALALADLVKKDIAEDRENIKNKTYSYIILTIMLAIGWLISIPLWIPFLKYIMNVNDYMMVYKLVLIQTPFYLLFLFNNSIFDSTFYGVGRTDYMLIQSIVIDVFYYGLMFILYLSGLFVPTILSISLMFGIGMTLDFIPTMVIYIKMLKKEEINIE